MDFSRASSALEARALASSILEALIISLTKSSTHSIPSIDRSADVDGSSVGASASVGANPTTKYCFPSRHHQHQIKTNIPKPRFLIHKVKIIILLLSF
jgi:hypothetical protein